MDALTEGVLFGVGYVVPVGAVALLVMDLGARRGFAPALAAGAGAATSDIAYATVMSLVAALASTFISENADLFLLLGGVVLVALAITGLYRFRTRPEPEVAPEDRGELGTFGVFVGLTITNGISALYFAAAIVGRAGSSLADNGEKAAFVFGIAVVALGWYALISFISGVTNRLLPPGARVFTRLVGNIVVLFLGARMLLDVF